MVVSVKVNLAPAPINVTQFIPGGNTPANGAQLFSYTAGSSTKQTCYTTSSGSVAWSNPIILDSGGNLTGSHEVWLAAGQVYDFTLAPSTDTDPPVSPYWTAQNLTGINDTTITSTEWIGLGSSTFAFVNASTFTVGGDVTGTLTPQRRLKTVNTAGTLYSTVTSSVFSVSTTTIGIQSDSTWLDSGLSSVNYGILSTVNDSLPYIISATRYGVKGDGSTDNSVSISTAVANVSSVLYFPKGTYNYSSSPNFAKQGLSVICDNGVLFNHTGTGNAFIIDAGSSSSSGVNWMEFRNVHVQGTSSSVNGIYVRGIFRSVFHNMLVTGCATTGAALRCDFALLNTWINFRATNSVPVPLYGIYLTRRNAGENTTTQDFINPVLENINTAGGAGIFIEYAATNTFIGGTSESNVIGVKISSTSPGFNTFTGIDLENNSTSDIDVQSSSNTFNGILSLGTVNVSSGNGAFNTFNGGRLTNVTLDAGCANTAFVNCNVTGTFTDSSPSTALTVQKDVIATGRIRSNKASAAPLSSSNANLMLYDAVLGAGLFGQQNSSTPFDFWLQAMSADGTSKFPITLNSLGGNVNVGNFTSSGVFNINTVTTVGASTGTLTNSPHAGNPTVWPRVNVNGSTFCFPCFSTT